ncbi:uncharacterized protein LOC122744552 [Dromiciops gliroides]|uniref:uncharacterized protein LOC122744552 n=1 Tax=Dromiciops gliroides TaxID=33562 RepID=UPI001CC6096A|nr:uncharacterized protein LOC122744552 [Dromiciops gliroides]
MELYQGLGELCQDVWGKCGQAQPSPEAAGPREVLSLRLFSLQDPPAPSAPCAFTHPRAGLRSVLEWVSQWTEEALGRNSAGRVRGEKLLRRKVPAPVGRPRTPSSDQQDRSGQRPPTEWGRDADLVGGARAADAAGAARLRAAQLHGADRGAATGRLDHLLPGAEVTAPGTMAPACPQPLRGRGGGGGVQTTPPAPGTARRSGPNFPT